MSTMRSQRLAVDVHRVVEARAPLNDGYPPRYASRVRNLSVWIRENGLIQTLMFLHDKASGKPDNADNAASKGPNPDRQLLDDLAVALKHGPSGAKLIDDVENASPAAYRLLTRDALAVSMWMKRWCETYPDKDQDENEDHEAQ